jgi:hypothetical protein
VPSFPITSIIFITRSNAMPRKKPTPAPAPAAPLQLQPTAFDQLASEAIGPAMQAYLSAKDEEFRAYGNHIVAQDRLKKANARLVDVIRTLHGAFRNKDITLVYEGKALILDSDDDGQARCSPHKVVLVG